MALEISEELAHPSDRPSGLHPAGAGGVPGSGPGTEGQAAVTASPRRARHRLDPVLLIAGIPLLIVLAWAVAPGLFTSHDPLAGAATEVMQAPSAAHWFGTDYLGRDVFARVVHGTSQTFLTAGIAVLVGMTLGSALGLAATTLGRWADPVIMRFVDVLLAIPSFLIALLIITAYEPGPVSLGIGVGIGSIAVFARVTRTEVMRIRSLDFVEAAYLNGGTLWSVSRRHIIPNAGGQILSLLTVDFAAAILVISSLGFLGFGSPPPTPEWGLIIAEGRQYLGTAWWMTTLPGLVIIITVVLLGVLGRHIQKQLRF